MKLIFTFAGLFSGLLLSAAPLLEISEFDGKEFHNLAKIDLGRQMTFQSERLAARITCRPVNAISEYTVQTANRTGTLLKLRLRFIMDTSLQPGGIFFDGFEYHSNVKQAVRPATTRYIFPMIGYLAPEGQLAAVGFAPSVVSSRFERQLNVSAKGIDLIFDNFTVLNPGESLDTVFVAMAKTDALYCVEAVEELYRAYPAAFRPVAGADRRIYGVGGYFFSNDANRLQQLEEARRFGLSWEWYYNAYQKAGDFYPSPEFWDEKRGYKTEKAHAACDTPGTIEDWRRYNRNRTWNGDRTTALFYYYMQQYANSELARKYYSDSKWVDAAGKGGYRSHGWAEEGWAEYTWPGRSGSFGKAIREDLKKLWDELDISGFALDCAIGDTRYYGEQVFAEPGKAFDEQGKVFAVEGVALAYNMNYTRNLPPKSDGRRAASIINEQYTYLPAFYADAAIHEMTPFERTDIIAPRRMMLGQKPQYWWKGFRIDAVLDWDRLSPEELHAGLSGIVRYVILASLRFGAVPAIFYQRGFEDIVKYRPLFVELQELGWRAAPYAIVKGAAKMDNPYADNAEYWISRFGEGDRAVVVISSPDPSPRQVELQIFTGKFGAGGQLYAPGDGTEVLNEVSPGVTVVHLTLSGQQPVILRPSGKVADGRHRVRYTPPTSSVHYQPENAREWIAATDFADAGKLNCAIVAEKTEYTRKDPAADQLRVYFEYYFSRLAQPVVRLWGMDKLWQTRYRLPVLPPDSPEAVKTPVLFILGESARKAFFPEAAWRDTVVFEEKDGQKRIAFFPGKLSEDDLIRDFLGRLDVKYPFSGGISEAWALKSKPRLYGLDFATGKPLQAPAAKPAAASPASAQAAVHSLSVLRPDEKSCILRSPFSDGVDLSVKLVRGINGELDFSTVRQVSTSVPLNAANMNAGNAVHYCVDEAAPLKANYTYIGGNHGAFVALDADISAHGLTATDIGKAMRGENGRNYYPVKILSPDRVQFVSENLGRGSIWKFDRTLPKKLTAVKTGKEYEVVKFTGAQLYPGVRIIRQEFLLDGKPLLPGPQARQGDSLEIIEFYEIIAPDTWLDNLIGRSDDRKPYAVVENHYRFHSAAGCTQTQKVKFLRDTVVDQIAGIQSQMLTPGKGQKLLYLIPKTLPFEQKGTAYDFASGQVIDGAIPPGGIFFSEAKKNLADPGDKPDRFIQLAGSDDKPEFGFAMGYSPREQAVRSANTATAMWIWTSKKSYPVALDLKRGKNIPAGFELTLQVYRYYFVPGKLSANAFSAYLVDAGNESWLFLDYRQPVSGDTVRFPGAADGSRVEVLECSPGTFPADREIRGGTIKITSTEKNGRIVLALKK